jgi:hypothetical protein
MAKAKQLKRPRRKPGKPNWEQELVERLKRRGARPPKIIKLTPLDLAWLRWGKADVHASEAEGARA